MRAISRIYLIAHDYQHEDVMYIMLYISNIECDVSTNRFPRFLAMTITSQNKANYIDFEYNHVMQISNRSDI